MVKPNHIMAGTSEESLQSDRQSIRLSHFVKVEEGLPVLMDNLGYQFRDHSYPKQALTHRSYNPKSSYERLEFLGDALLGVIMAEYLYHHFGALDEGRLTRMRATLVRQESLVLIAEKLSLYRHLVLGIGERKGGGRHRASILADVVEALIGAIYLDSGSLETVRACVLSWYAELLAQVTADIPLKDAKSRLQELLQAKKNPLPTYALVSVTGNPPEQTFAVSCQVAQLGIEPVLETGASRRIAEQKCAERMINQLNLVL